MKIKTLSLLTTAGILMAEAAPSVAQCDVKYNINNNWGSGATISVDVTNFGATSNAWELRWDFANSEKISQLWNGNYSQQNNSVAARNASWNGTIGTNQTVNFGFNIAHNSGNALLKPQAFYLNGTKCLGKASSSLASSSRASSVSSYPPLLSSSSSSIRSSSSSSSTSSYPPPLLSSSSSSIRSSSSSSSTSSYPPPLPSSSSSSIRSSSGSSSSAPLTACTTEFTYGPRLLRVLTRSEYRNAIADLTGQTLSEQQLNRLPLDTQVNGFKNNTQKAIDTQALQAFYTVANGVASLASARSFTGILDCSGLTNAQCANNFIAQVLPRIFRRPVTTDEAQEYAALFAPSLINSDNNQGLSLALATALASPAFLYRSEVGVAVSELRAGSTQANLPSGAIDKDAFVLTPYEMASYLAFTFTGSTPDDELLNAAKNQQLSTDAQLQAQALRLLNSPKARTHFAEFPAQWLALDKASQWLPNDQLNFAKMEAQMVFNHVVLDQVEPFSTLFASNYTFANPALLNAYGIPTSFFDTSFRKVSLNGSGHQGGLLTSGIFVASNSNSLASEPTQVALNLRNRVLCQDAYAAVDTSGQPQREQPFWQVGYAYQNLSPLGAPISQDSNGNPVNSSGVLTGINYVNDGLTLAFSGAEDLARQIAQLPAARLCFVEHSFRAAMGTGTRSYDPQAMNSTLSPEAQSDYACAKATLDAALTSAGPKAMLTKLSSLSAARYRKARN